MTNPINEPHEDRDDLLQRSLAALRDAPVPPGPSAQTAADTLAALRRAAGNHQSKRNGFVERILTMTFTQRLAAAVMLTIGGVVIWFMLTLFSTVSYAQVAEKIRDAHSMTCSVTMTLPGQKDPISFKMMFKDPGRLRHEGPGTRVSIMDQTSGETLSYDPATKTAMVIKYDQHGYGFPDSDVGAEFKKLADQKGEPIGEKQIGSVKAKGFRVKEDGRPASVWADPKTGMPLQVEMSFPLGGQSAQITMSDFVFDAKLDDSLFSMEPPAGYKISSSKLTVNLNIEENVVTLLRAYAAANDGKFPPALNDMSVIPPLVKTNNQGKPDADTIKLSTAVGALFGTLFNLEKGVDYDYLPGDAKLGDAAKIVFWRREKEGGKYHAVYGDLAVKDVKAEDLPHKK